MARLKPAIMDLSKWIEKTAQLVRRRCSRKTGIPIAVSMVFFDPFAKPEEKWSYTVDLAYDPNEFFGEKDIKEIQASMMFCNRYIQKILGGQMLEKEVDALIEILDGGRH